MTAADLIARLSIYPPDTPVCVRDWDGNVADDVTVRTCDGGALVIEGAL